jgi:hypothetical protein
MFDEHIEVLVLFAEDVLDELVFLPLAEGDNQFFEVSSEHFVEMLLGIQEAEQPVEEHVLAAIFGGKDRLGDGLDLFFNFFLGLGNLLSLGNFLGILSLLNFLFNDGGFHLFLSLLLSLDDGSYFLFHNLFLCFHLFRSFFFDNFFFSCFLLNFFFLFFDNRSDFLLFGLFFFFLFFFF